MTTKADRMRRLASKGMGNAEIAKVVEARHTQEAARATSRTSDGRGRKATHPIDHCPTCAAAVRTKLQAERIRAKGLETVRG